MTKTTTTTEDDLSVSVHRGATAPRVVRRGRPLRVHRSADPSSWSGNRPQRVLVAGDDVFAVATLVDAVSAPQREVHSASCSDLALELVLHLHFDLVVLHLDRPGAGGIEVSHCIRTCHELQQPTIVLVSRPLDEDTWTEALHCGADLVLPEPADAPAATTALRDVLR